jgi:hypothetical protein
MSELADFVGIHGAVDRAVVADPARRAAVAQLLPLYQEPGVQWFDEFEDWTRELREDQSEDPFPDLKEALRDLGTAEERPRQRERRPPRPRMQARRLFAIALAARAFPELRDPDSELASLARDALRIEGFASTVEEAQRLLDLLGDEWLLPPIEQQSPGALDEWWTKLLDTAFAENLIPDPASLGPRPCTGRLVMVDLPDGSSRQVATLMTSFDTEQVEFEKAIRFLEPANWPDCSAFWCDMDKTGEAPPGTHQYHEVVSTDCDHQPAAWTITAELDFTFWKIGDIVAVAEYKLSQGHPKPGDHVLVDEGSLVVRRIRPAHPRLRVITTKRVLFDRVFNGRSLALTMCALGYASVVEDFVFNCAALAGEGAGTAFPGQAPVAPPEPECPELSPTITALTDEAAAAVKACVDECAHATQSSLDKIAAGSYTADALVQDVANMSARMLRDSATAVDLGVRSARLGARPRVRKPPES